ncbi:hypothetical protein Taro_036613 [Colocasia esculenta]|uniref:Uncharacterized protein n=1 Tax=Colocasia esculenta TaxID=4460 RepID=A0A843WDW3_COLES|nr:hypothetical protein [Colocasia esculenta]
MYYRSLVSQVTTLHTTTGLDWSDERPGVIAMDRPQYPRAALSYFAEIPLEPVACSHDPAENLPADSPAACLYHDLLGRIS